MAEPVRIQHHPEGVPAIDAPYSLVVSSGDLVLVSGQVASDGSGAPVEGGFEVQMRQVMDNLARCLAAAGCGFEHVLKVGCFLSSYDYYDDYNRLFREYFDPPYPARTTVHSQLPGFLLEIDAIARRPAEEASE